MTKVEESEEETKTRISDLKNYLYSLRDHVGYQLKPIVPKLETKIKPVNVEPKPIPTSSPSLSKRQEMEEKVENLKMQIKTKVETLCGKNNSSKSQKLTLDSNKSIPVTVRVYQSKWRSVENLSRMIDLLTDDDWEIHGLYMGKLSFIIVGENSLSPLKIGFLDIQLDSLQIYNKYISFAVGSSTERVFVLDFGEKQVGGWEKFICYISYSKYYLGLGEEKWGETYLESKERLKNNQDASFLEKNEQTNKSENSQIISKLSSIKNDPRQQSKSKFRLNSVGLSRKGGRKESEKSESFILSNSTEKNRNTNPNNYSNFQIDMIKIKSDKLNESIQFEIVDQGKDATIESKLGEITLKDMVIGDQDEFSESQFFNKPNISDANFDNFKNLNEEFGVTEKVQNKLSEKMKLLQESSLSKLNIHWHEESDSEPVLIPETSEIQDFNSNPSTNEIRLFSKKKESFSSKNQEISERRDTGDSPQSKKRIESAFVKEDDNTSQNDPERIRKKTDFSLQNDTKVELERRRNKNEIRDHYLHRLIEKERSRNGNNSASSNKDDHVLIPIPERKTPSISHYESIKFESYDSNNFSQSSNESTEQEIELQELKNGITLEKCSKRMPWTQNKKLSITNTMSELCYCDKSNIDEERRFFIKDVLSIEYGKFEAGIMKHKKNYEENRCLLIRVRQDGKEKIIEFYLEESEPAENLEDFARKLKSFIDREKEREENSED